MYFTSRLHITGLRLAMIFIVILITVLSVYILYPVVLKKLVHYGELNISVFAYRDINRNGSYDIDDRPYAGLLVEMERPAGKNVKAWSNISGFTNFKMSLNDRRFDVYQAGEHVVSAKPQNGWKVTSHNSAQTVNFIELEQAPVKIIAEHTFEPIGVAPNLTVTGRIKRLKSQQNTALFFIEAVAPSGEILEVPLVKTDSFSFVASSGNWLIKIYYDKNIQTIRQVSVDQYAVVVSTIDLGQPDVEVQANIQKIGFDDLTSSDTLFEIPNGYKGLNWINWIATHQKLYRGYGYINSTISAEYMAYNSSGHPAVIESEKPFDFVGGFVGAAWEGTAKHDVILRAWHNSKLVYQDKLKVSTAGPVYFNANYSHITKLEVSSPAYWQVVIDDFIFRTTDNELLE